MSYIIFVVGMFFTWLGLSKTDERALVIGLICFTSWYFIVSMRSRRA